MSDRQSGFVLVSSIWLTLIMLVFAGLFNNYASRYLDAAVASKSRIESSMEKRAVESTLMFLFATYGSSRRGLELENDEFIRLDGSLYHGTGQAFFRVNDHYGLVGLNSARHFHLEHLLKSYESSGIRRQELVAALVDYIDSDNLASLSGREAPAYRVKGMAEPSNEYLLTPTEIYKVYGWSEWLSRHPDVDLDWFSTNWRSRLNINAVPETLLPSILPLSNKDRELIVQRRRDKAFRSMGELAQVLRLRSSLDEDFYTFLPSGEVRFRVYSANDSKLTSLSVRFTPMNLESPWHIDYRYLGERNFDLPAISETAAEKDFGRELFAAEDFR